MANKLLKTLTMDGTSYDVPLTGVKGKQETNYRTGNVNLTPENILYIGYNPHGSLANDTREKWVSLGTGYAYINGATMTTGQPTAFGWIISIVQGNNIVQYFYTWHDGIIYRRRADETTTSMPSWIRTETRVKGQQETDYRMGDVNLTPANIGAPSGVKGKQETNYRIGNVNLTPENILYIGYNPHGSLANDTREKWASLGTGYAYINGATMTSGQPTAFGWIINIVQGNSSVAQFFVTWHDAKLYRRRADDRDTSMPAWTEIGSADRRLPNTVNINYDAPGNINSGSLGFVDLYTAPSAGLVIATIHVGYISNTNGYRFLRAVDTDYNGDEVQAVPACNGATTDLCVTCIKKLNNGGKIRASLFQNSGSNLSYALNIRGMFIPD